MRERGLTREGKDRSIHPETLRKCRGEKTLCGGVASRRWAGPVEGKVSPAWSGRKEEARPGPVSSDTPLHPLDTPPTDPRPEERVQPQQTAETHSLRAGGGAAPRRAWYGGRAGTGASDSLGERAEGGPGCWGGGSRRTEGAVRGWEEVETVLRSASGSLGREGTLLWALEGDPGCGCQSLLCFAPFSFPAAKFDCLPGASKNSLLRSLASCPSVPAPVPLSPGSGILERMT